MDKIIERALKIGMIQVPFEIQELGKTLLEHKPKCVVEIGTKYGGTTYFLASLLPESTIYTIDLPRTNPESIGLVKARNMWMDALFPYRVHFVAEDSKVVAPLFKNIDFLFIDGDHTYEGVKSDFELYKDGVKPGGLIAFHDIVDSERHRNQNCYVSKFWDEIKHNTQDYIVEEFLGGEDWGGIGLLHVK